MKHGGVDWLLPDDAIRAIIAAKEAGIPILGFDGAFLREKATQPSMADCWDYSLSSVPDPYAHAVHFIAERAEKGLHFEIVLGREKSS